MLAVSSLCLLEGAAGLLGTDEGICAHKAHKAIGYSPSRRRSWPHSSRAPTWKHAVQMGGPEGVLKRERYTLVIGLKGGMYMHAVPRVPTAGADGQESSTTTSDEDC